VGDPVPSSAISDATTGGLSVIIITGGSTGDVLTKQSDGTYAPVTPSSGGSPGGSSGQVQYNNAGAFGGMTAVVYAGTGSHVTITAQAAATIPLCVKGAASQSGNLQEWQNSSGTQLVTVSSDGNIRLFRSTGSDVVELDRNSSGQGRLIVRATTGSYPGAGVIVDQSGYADLASFSAGSPNSYFRAAGTPQVCEAGVLATVWYQSAIWSWTHRTTSPAAWGDRPGLYSRVVGGLAEWHMMDSSGNVLVLDPRAFGTDNSSTAGHTRFFLWDVDKGALSRVTVGAADSGGTGFKLLRVPN